MKKLTIGLLAVGGVLAVGSLVKRKAHRMREHCEQMAAKCKQMMAQSRARGEEAEMREHCEQMAARGGDRRAPVAA